MSPVCISGMHRSGTSMIAGLLRVCGLELGGPEDLMKPAPDNPGGFFENRLFVTLDDELLAAAGGSWDAPPAHAEWASSRFAPQRSAAGQVIKRFAGLEPWGWKDPRSSLTLEFWRGIMPDLRVVAALRNPLEVATSLQRRNGLSIEGGLSMWCAYNVSLVEVTGPEQRLVSHYDKYFVDPKGEIRRLLHFADLRPSREALNRACAGIDPGSRHSRFTTQDLARAGASNQVLELYGQLEEESARGVAGVER